MEKEFKNWIVIIALAIILSLTLSTFFIPSVVKGESMVPTLYENDYIIIQKKNIHLDYGDIIVFDSSVKNYYGDYKELVKRIVAKPGDQVRIAMGKVYINDKAILEEYLKEKYTEGEIEMVVPENHYFVLGDNRAVSLDSREPKIGVIHKEDILGKVIYDFSFSN